MDLPPGPGDVVPPPIASCAHRRLPSECIVDDDFYAKLRDARELDRAERRSEKRSKSVPMREPRATTFTPENESETDGDDPKRLSSKYTTEKFCSKTFSAKHNSRLAGIMSDNSDQKILDEP